MTDRRFVQPWSLLLVILFAGSIILVPGLAPSAEALLLKPVKVEVVNDPLNVYAVNDSLNELYSRTEIGSASPSEPSGTVAFDVPEGKRLVIETITFRVTVPAGQAVFAGFNIGGALGALTTQAQGTFGGSDIFQGTHPIKLRVDGAAAPNEVSIFFGRNFATGDATIQATVSGYLVPLPTP